MIFDMPNIDFSDDEWVYIITEYLNGWTEIPLSTSCGYDLDELKFYDGLLGTLLKHTEKLFEEAPELVNYDFVNSWKYQGKLYRVIHGFCELDENGNETYIHPNVLYHGMISHWTNDYKFEGLMHKLPPDCVYTILEADTKEHLAFDVNKFRKSYHCERPFTEKEREIIFPMYKENIKEYCMTINEFIKTKEQEINGKKERQAAGYQ